MLPKKRIIRSFPEDFTVYLDSLDLRVPADVEELGEVLEAVGKQCLHDAAPRLYKEQGFLQPDRAERLLSSESFVVAPLLRVFLDLGGPTYRGQILTYLKQLNINDKSACLTRFIEDAQLIPVEYLRLLLDRSEEAIRSTGFRDMVATTICRWVERSAGRVHLLERRVYAIRTLEGFPTRHAQSFLKKLIKSSRFLVFATEPSPVRQAAREVLEAYKRYGPIHV